jgi:hypothetical protein
MKLTLIENGLDALIKLKWLNAGKPMHKTATVCVLMNATIPDRCKMINAGH